MRSLHMKRLMCSGLLSDLVSPGRLTKGAWRVLAAYALYKDLMFEVEINGCTAKVGFVKSAKRAAGKGDQDPGAEQLSKQIKELETKSGGREGEGTPTTVWGG